MGSGNFAILNLNISVKTIYSKKIIYVKAFSQIREKVFRWLCFKHFFASGQFLQCILFNLLGIKQERSFLYFAMQIRVKLGVHADALVSLFNITEMLNVKFSFYNSFAGRKEQK
jgi:hypothetical protein